MRLHRSTATLRKLVQPITFVMGQVAALELLITHKPSLASLESYLYNNGILLIAFPPIFIVSPRHTDLNFLLGEYVSKFEVDHAKVSIILQILYELETGPEHLKVSKSVLFSSLVDRYFEFCR